jgi:tRNA-specific 2-thiouridylase
LNKALLSSATVAVAMSGGVDSSVAAALLVEKGCRVFGVTARLWRCAETPVHARPCCSPASIDDAGAVAAKLGIPHHVVDLESVFDERVVGPFCLEYSRGRTPNPCVLCNAGVKFDVLLERALSLGADALATGHYARLDRAGGGLVLLRRALDRQKDQSYVLWGIKKERLAQAVFPLGELTKEEVRLTASELGLPSAERLESQDVCFVESKNCGAFVTGRLSQAGVNVCGGQIVDRSGKVVGAHAGLVHFTVGQRRGLGVAQGERRYVVELREDSNTVVIGEKRHLLARGFQCVDMNWLAGTPVRFPVRASVQIRYTHQQAGALLKEIGPERLAVAFDVEQSAITPGQSAVFYEPDVKGDVVLGGGIIDVVTRT